MSTPTLKPWTHRYTLDGWQVHGSDDSWVATFVREGDCLLFMRLAGPQPDRPATAEDLAESGGALWLS